MFLPAWARGTWFRNAPSRLWLAAIRTHLTKRIGYSDRTIIKVTWLIFGAFALGTADLVSAQCDEVNRQGWLGARRAQCGDWYQNIHIVSVNNVQKTATQLWPFLAMWPRFTGFFGGSKTTQSPLKKKNMGKRFDLHAAILLRTYSVWWIPIEIININCIWGAPQSSLSASLWTIDAIAQRENAIKRSRVRRRESIFFFQ